MRVLAFIFATLLLSALLQGCSTKQINETTDSITTDIKDFGEKVTEQH